MTYCLECQNLTRVFESRLSKYVEARSAALYRISTEFAAKQLVDMERARNDKEEHALICRFRRQAEKSGPAAAKDSRPCLASAALQA